MNVQTAGIENHTAHEQNRSQLKCPLCGRRLIDTKDITKSRLEMVKPGVAADYYIWCRGCKHEVAIHKTV